VENHELMKCLFVPGTHNAFVCGGHKTEEEEAMESECGAEVRSLTSHRYCLSLIPA